MTTNLADVCLITMGQAPSGDSYNSQGEGLPLIAGAGDFDGLRLSPKKFTSMPGKTSAEGDIILGIRASIGAKVWSDGEYCLGRGVAGLRPKSALDADYLWHWLTHSKQALVAKGRGATFLQVNRRDIGEMPINLPPLPEQRRIAAILDQADALRAKRRQVLAYLDSLTQSVFHDMFGDVPATSIVEAEASLIRTGPFGSQLLHSEFVDEGVAVLGLDNVVGNAFRWGERRFITPAKYEQLRRYTVNPGDVLISIMGTTGRCVVVPEDIPTAINTKHICAISPNRARIDSSFLRAAFLWHPDSLAHLRRQTKGSIMDGVNMGIIKAMPIPVPPIADQQEFAARVEQVARWGNSVDLAVKANEELFVSLQSRAFRGEL